MAADSRSADPVAPRAVQAWQALGTALAQWCGPFAYHSVVTRAVALVQSAAPALAPLRVAAPPGAMVEGFAEIEAAHGSVALLEAVQQLLAAVIAILERVIGDQMAMRVVSDALRPLRLPPTTPAPSSAADS